MEAAHHEHIQLKSGVRSLCYKGPVKSFDDNKDNVLGSKQGLVVLLPILEENEHVLSEMDLEVEKSPKKIIITLQWSGGSARLKK